MTEFLLANMAPIMFAGLVVFLLMGFSVAFSLAACGLLFGFIGIELGVPGMASLMQALPLRLFGIMQTTRCSRSRSSPSWARYWRDAGSPRTCWIRWASCSARSAAASAIP